MNTFESLAAGFGAFILVAAYFDKTRPCLTDVYPVNECPFVLPSLAAFGIAFAAARLYK